MKTLTEREENRLWNGKEYTSLPDDIEKKKTVRWRELETSAHQEPNLEKLQESIGEPDEIPYKPAGMVQLDLGCAFCYS